MLILSTALAATLTVGPDGDFSTVADAIESSSPGDEILVTSGEYLDDTVSFPHGDLTIRGVGDTRPVLRVTQNIPNRKGIFAIGVDAGPVTVEFLHFEGARISDSDGANGAGIRMQGQALTVRDCVFTDNQMGLLAGGTDDFTVWVEDSEFDANAQEGSGYEHNIYIGTDQCALFTFIGNYSHHAHSGHNLKSRCQENHILYNRLGDEDDGDSSYVIDLPEGGRSVLVGNLVQQGPYAENSSAIISYGAEGDNDEMLLYASHNTIVNDKDTQNTSFIHVRTAESVVLRNNLFVGTGTPVDVQNGSVDDEGSWHEQSDEVLADRAGYDYHLVEGSGPQDAGVEIDIEELVPTLQYLHPTDTEPRWDDGAPDIGAYGIGTEPADTDDSGDGGDGDDDTGTEDTAVSGCRCAQVSGSAGLVWVLGLLAWSRRRGGLGAGGQDGQDGHEEFLSDHQPNPSRGR
ncbi:MAG TPA: hypothetical protein QGF58_15355 [Myxococcota bacterium]|nr:hypothetical protein [Myxococcota bacterium]